MRTLGKKSGKRRSVAAIQMAPMIDMVFLLIVFFMCVSSISQAGLRREVDLPESEESEVPEDLSNRITVSIDSEYRIFLNASLIEKNRLSRALSNIAVESSDLKLNVRADQSVPYGEVKAIMRAAAEAGISEIVYATHQK